MRDVQNRIIHLTNDAVQKHGNQNEIKRYEIGLKLSFSDLDKYIDSLPGNEENAGIFKRHIVPQMVSIATDCVRATYWKIDQNRKEFGFELMGMDFMIDENYKVWILEINSNPDLRAQCPVLFKVIPPLIDNVFRICVDP